MEIRLLTPSDTLAYRALSLQAVRELPPEFHEEVAHLEKLSVDDFRLGLSQTENPAIPGCVLTVSHVFGAFAGDLLVGFGMLQKAVDHPNHSASLLVVHVDQQFRRRGFGRALVEYAIGHSRADCPALGVCVRRLECNDGAFALFRSMGFVDSGYGICDGFELGPSYDEVTMKLSFA